MANNRAYRRRNKKKNKHNLAKTDTIGKVKAYVLLAVLVVVAILVNYWLLFAGFPTESLQEKNVQNQILDPSFVCMVNNNFKGRKMIPVSIEGKTYYSCCRRCEWKLKNRPELYHAIDPFTGEKVDKAGAVITFDPTRYPAVLYFGSLQNAEEYLGYELGNKEEIFKLAQTSYMVSVADDNLAPGGVVHNGAFILIDSKRRVRGHYDGTKAGEVDKLMNDIEILLPEENAQDVNL